MDIKFLPIKRRYDEIEMGHCLWFYEMPTNLVMSATANWNGFTPLNAIARHYGWDCELVEKASVDCNDKEQVITIAQLQPQLLLIPKTIVNKSISDLTNELLVAANKLGLQELRFTHYGFVQNKLPKDEVKEILDVLLDPNLVTTIKTLYWDIDTRVSDELINLHQKVVLALN